MRHVLLFVSIFALLSSCSRVKIYDDPWCADAGKFGAECFNTISNTEFSINKYEWDKLRTGQICTATESAGEGYAHIKNSLEKLCADSSFCSPEQKAAIEQISRKVDNALAESGGAPPFEGIEDEGSEPAISALSEEPISMGGLELQPEK